MAGLVAHIIQTVTEDILIRLVEPGHSLKLCSAEDILLTYLLYHFPSESVICLLPFLFPSLLHVCVYSNYYSCSGDTAK